jgi:4-hydroxybenzoyl-CoA thioesterase
VLTNRRLVRIEWGDCDPAGIVYFPRYFEMFDACTAELFELAGLPKGEMIQKYKIIGTPVVEVQADFSMPSSYGDNVLIETSIPAWKISSFRVEHRLMKGPMLAIAGFETRVWAIRHPDDPDRLKAKPIPREVIERFKKAPAPEPPVLTKRAPR